MIFPSSSRFTETLKDAINDDIKQAKEKLDQDEFAKFKSDDFFSSAALPPTQTQTKEETES